MKFKIGEISKLSGFSPSGIRFFEEAGVISPARGSNEKYREYSLSDLQRLLICRKYRECGFSLQESVEMLLHAWPRVSRATGAVLVIVGSGPQHARLAALAAALNATGKMDSEARGSSGWQGKVEARWTSYPAAMNQRIQFSAIADRPSAMNRMRILCLSPPQTPPPSPPHLLLLSQCGRTPDPSGAGGRGRRGRR